MRGLALGLAAALALLAPAGALAHGGGLDANGCHTERRTGKYHCHRSSYTPPPPPPRYSPPPPPPVRQVPQAQGLLSQPSGGGIAAGTAERVTGAEAVMICMLLLQELGYDVGPVGPTMTAKAGQAVQEFQEKVGLEETHVNGRILLALAQEVGRR